MWLSFVVLAGLYLPYLGAPLAWDDKPTILYNREIGRPHGLADYLTAGYFRSSGEATWRPLATWSYRCMFRALGPSPAGFRAVGLLLHLANAFLLLLFLRGAGLAPEARRLAAALFLAHPAHIETLMCVSFNEELLTGFGLLIMLNAHQRGRPFAAALGFAAALLSKETALLGLPLVLLLDALGGERPSLREGLRTCGAYAALAGLYLWLRFGRLTAAGDADILISLPLWERLSLALMGWVTALRVWLAPVGLRIEYVALPPASAGEVAAWAAAFLAAAWLLGRLALRWWRGERRLLLFLAWPLLFMAAFANLLPAGALNMKLMNERWLYLPILGGSAALGRLLCRPGRFRWAGICVIAAWAACGFLRMPDWGRPERLWESLVKIYPWHANAYEGIGKSFLSEGRYPEARSAFEEALRLRESRQDKMLAHYVPLDVSGRLRWESLQLDQCLALSFLGSGDEAQARRMFLRAAAADPGSLLAHRMLAHLCARAGDFQEARRWLRQGLSLSPGDGFLLRLKEDVDRRRKPSPVSVTFEG